MVFKGKNMKNIIKPIVYISFLSLIVFGCSSKDTSAPATPFVPNQSPIMRDFRGPSESKVGETCVFQASGFDPDGSTVAFHLAHWITDKPHTYKDLGFTNYVNNDVVVTWSVIFEEADLYTLCCYCKDQKGNESAHIEREIPINE